MTEKPTVTAPISDEAWRLAGGGAKNIQHALDLATRRGRNTGLEEAAEICDNRSETGDVFATQIRGLKT